MRAIPTEVQTVLKSRSMIGANKPAHEVTIGAGGDLDWDTATTAHAPHGETSDAHPSWAQLSDGRILYMYSRGTTLYQAYITDLETFLGQDGTIASEAVVLSNLDYPRATMFFAPDGELYFILAHRGANSDNVAKVQVYKSALKDGSDWALHATIQTQAWQGGSNNTLGSYQIGVTYPLFLGTKWIVGMPAFGLYSSYLRAFIGIYVSTDNGATWTKKGEFKLLDNIVGTTYISRNFGVLNSEIWGYWGDSYGSEHRRFIKSTDNGETWSSAFSSDNVPMNVEGLIFSDGNYLYNADSNDAGQGLSFYRTAISPTQYTDFVLFKTVSFMSGNGASNSMVAIPIGNKMTIGCYKNATFAYEMIMGFDEVRVTLPVRSISISRNKNMAGSLDLLIDNKSGEWAPDGTTHPGVLWPNKEIVVQQGYGTNLVKTFTGLVDRIEMNTFPAEIRVSLRDNLKLALDQTVSVPWQGGTSHNLTYWDRSPEWIFADLAAKAGITTGTIEETGLVINEKKFSWESYLDAFTWLASASGNFEVYADEEGLACFRRDTVPAEPTIAYVFREGEDIINIGYTIDDADIYYKVAVYGKTPDTVDGEGKTVAGHVVFASRDYVSRNYYKVLPQKFLKIDAAEAAGSVEACQAIADQAEALMRSRVRTVTFAAIAVPWLQVGDVIQVIETSTTISELYRITDLSTTMSESGYIMTITCYHHGAA